MNLMLSILLMGMMCMASLASPMLKPTHKMANDYPKRFDLEHSIPKEFGQWKEVEEGVGLINPETSTAIHKIYAQTLSRTYQNTAGEKIMLSMAYGEDQSDEVGIHLPEGCYSGQGFKITSHSRVTLGLNNRMVPVTQLVSKRSERIEPITYWLRTGDFVQYPSWQTKWIKMRYAFHGNIPDGLLVRVSSLVKQEDESQIKQAFRIQESFLVELVSNADTTLQRQLLGQR